METNATPAVPAQPPTIYFENAFMQAITEKCFACFNPRTIQVDVWNRTVTIQDTGIYLQVSFSANENKATFQPLPLTPALAEDKAWLDRWLVTSFRVFSVKDALSYLELRQSEQKWVLEHQG